MQESLEELVKIVFLLSLSSPSIPLSLSTPLYTDTYIFSLEINKAKENFKNKIERKVKKKVVNIRH